MASILLYCDNTILTLDDEQRGRDDVTDDVGSDTFVDALVGDV